MEKDFNKVFSFVEKHGSIQTGENYYPLIKCYELGESKVYCFRSLWGRYLECEVKGKLLFSINEHALDKVNAFTMGALASLAAGI